MIYWKLLLVNFPRRGISIKLSVIWKIITHCQLGPLRTLCSLQTPRSLWHGCTQASPRTGPGRQGASMLHQTRKLEEQEELNENMTHLQGTWWPLQIPEDYHPVRLYVYASEERLRVRGTLSSKEDIWKLDCKESVREIVIWLPWGEKTTSPFEYLVFLWLLEKFALYKGYLSLIPPLTRSYVY